MAANDKKTTVKGGCHCGYIKYNLDYTPETETGQPSATRCNCSFCQKLGTAVLRLPDPSNFHLLSPASKDDPELGNYRGKSDSINRYFCKTCGTHIFMEGSFVFGDQTVKFFTVNVATIDQPQEGVDLSEIKVKYFDGLHDNFGAEPRDRPWSGGLP